MPRRYIDANMGFKISISMKLLSRIVMALTSNLKSYLRRLKSISIAELNTVLMGLQAGASNTDDGETTQC